MATLSFETLRFAELQDKVRVIFLKIYEFFIDRKELEKIAPFKLEGQSITFDCDDNRAQKFSLLLEKGFKNLTNIVTKKPTTYIHKTSGIPLLGNIAFGVLDRDTTVIEVRPISGCNIRCVYCSVNDDARVHEFVVEADYLIEEFKKVIMLKKQNNVEAHIASQGEPTLYADLPRLIKGLRAIKEVGDISIDTNGTLLNEAFIDTLIESGLTRINLSLNAMSREKADEVAGTVYNFERIKKMAEYISKKCKLIIAPVWVPGLNDDDMEQLVAFTKSLKNNKFTAKIGIQKFLPYKHGRNCAKEMPWEEFYAKLKEWKQKYGEEVFVGISDFNFKEAPVLEKPFKQEQVIPVEIIGKGRLPNEKLAIAKGRLISFFTDQEKGKTRIKIKRTKHNIFNAEVV
ncbi:radical SAM protein [Candidatus Woesearchaeota archaeon]|nr:radical SAM protein [Candidatus Woesearchaeota archaeon]